MNNLNLDKFLKECNLDKVAQTLNFKFGNIKTNQEEEIKIPINELLDYHFPFSELEIKETNNENLKHLFDIVCDEYARRLCEMYDWYFEDGFWVAEIRGGVFCTSDIEYSLSIEDIKLLVDNNIPFKEFQQWWDYNYRMHMAINNNPNDKNLHEINLWTWIRGYHGDKDEEWLKSEENKYWLKMQKEIDEN